MKWFKVKFKPFLPDQITLFINQNAQQLYEVLINHYPELTNLHKYVTLELAFTSVEFQATAAFFAFNLLESYWSYDSNISDIKFLLARGLPCGVKVRLSNGSPHAVTVIGFDDTVGKIIYHDPLGDPAFDYKLFCGYGIRCDYADFYRRAGSDTLTILFYASDEHVDIINEIHQLYHGRKLYYFSRLNGLSLYTY